MELIPEQKETQCGLFSSIRDFPKCDQEEPGKTGSQLGQLPLHRVGTLRNWVVPRNQEVLGRSYWKATTVTLLWIGGSRLK